MNCVRCEVARARVIATALRIVGNTDITIASKLRERYTNAEYYIASDGVYRANSLPPFTPYRILERKEDG